MGLKKILTRVGTGMALTAFTTVASAADNCSNNLFYDINNEGISIYTQSADGSLSRYNAEDINVDGQNFTTLIEDINKIRDQLENNGISTRIDGSPADGTLVSDFLGSPLTAQNLAIEYASISTEIDFTGMPEEQADALNKFVKLSEIVRDFQNLGGQLSGLDAIIKTGEFSIENESSPTSNCRFKTTTPPLSGVYIAKP